MDKNLSGSLRGAIDEMLEGSVAGNVSFSSGDGSNVTITPTLESGTKIADFTIDDTTGELYAPTPEQPIEYSAGANIQIEDGVISATDTKYTAGANIQISENNVISASGGGVNYSTEEQVVGTWINGKPIYQKTFNSNISLSSGWTETNLYIPDLDGIIKAEVVRNLETGSSAFGAISVNIDIDRETKRIDIFNLRTITLDVTSLTVWYTKSTDTVEND